MPRNANTDNGAYPTGRFIITWIMITHKPIGFFEKGLIQKLLKNSYRDLLTFFPDEKQRLYGQWEREDIEAFNNPDTIGKHVLITCINDDPVGYFSWDDRQYPLGIVGQNCILPDYRGKGLGKKQIEYLIGIFQRGKFNEIIAITGDHQYFISAQKMYLSCGFRQQRKIQGDLFQLVEFFKLI
jgi:GNAT superfamily N-acetyltransferase